MNITKEEAKKLFRESGLRFTAPRMAVLQTLASARNPLSHSEVLKRLGETDWDPATIYRNLIKLREAGLAQVVNRTEGIDRYTFTGSDEDDHRHPHFVCEDCGRVACLPSELSSSMSVKGRWAASVRQAVVQLNGECPDCLERIDHRPG